MTELRIEVDASEVANLERTYRQAGTRAPTVIARAINHTGDKADTQVTRSIARTAGLKYGTVAEALTQIRASASNLVYVIRARGPATSLKEFGARQTKKGVSAAPWGQRRVFPHTFGPNIAKLGGHVFVRTSDARLPIKKLWGPAIPNEMVRDESRQAFETTVAAELPARLEHELGALLAGHAPG